MSAARMLPGKIATAKALRQYLKDNHVQVSSQRGLFGIGGDSTAETAQTLVSQFNFVVVLLGLMAIIIAIVGSIALSGTLSLSVMERTREIGVMRAIGASSWDISRLFIGEGLILGWLSWLIALPLSVPAGKLMLTAVSQAFGQDYLYHYTPDRTDPVVCDHYRPIHPGKLDARPQRHPHQRAREPRLPVARCSGGGDRNHIEIGAIEASLTNSGDWQGPSGASLTNSRQ